MTKINKFIEDKEKEFLEVGITDLLVLIHGSEFEKPILAKLIELLTDRKQFLTQSLLEMAEIAKENKLDKIVREVKNNKDYCGEYLINKFE